MEKKTQEKELIKLMIDDPSDFVFHAAYMAYSKTWDENPSKDARSELNEIMLSFSKGEIDDRSFYSEIHAFRRDINSEMSIRSTIRTQKKRAWRKKEQRKTRLSRYKK